MADNPMEKRIFGFASMTLPSLVWVIHPELVRNRIAT